jgi:hypothetical protein
LAEVFDEDKDEDEDEKENEDNDNNDNNMMTVMIVHRSSCGDRMKIANTDWLAHALCSSAPCTGDRIGPGATAGWWSICQVRLEGKLAAIWALGNPPTLLFNPSTLQPSTLNPFNPLTPALTLHLHVQYGITDRLLSVTQPQTAAGWSRYLTPHIEVSFIFRALFTLTLGISLT